MDVNMGMSQTRKGTRWKKVLRKHGGYWNTVTLRRNRDYGDRKGDRWQKNGEESMGGSTKQ